MQSENDGPPWMARALRLAAIADVLGGAWLVLAPTSRAFWPVGSEPLYPAAWQALGLFLLSSGCGHWLAARRPIGLWPLTMVGLTAKVLLSLGFLIAATSGQLPWELGALVLALGPIWWIPFGLILRSAARNHRDDQTPPVLPVEMALSLYQDQAGTDLLAASAKQPLFLVFLRHFGCTFCREAISDLAAINDRLRAAGTRLVLVHMSAEDQARELFRQNGLEGVTGISDPDRVLYRAFALRRGRPSQLLGWSVWKRGWEAGIKQGHGIGWLRGDAAQMPGAFVVAQGKIVAQFIHESAADRPDYIDLASEGVDAAEFQQELEQEGVGFGFQERLRKALAAKAGEMSGQA